MKTLEAITYLLGQFGAASFGYLLGADYGASIGWAAFFVMAVLVDIRARIKPYWVR